MTVVEKYVGKLGSVRARLDRYDFEWSVNMDATVLRSLVEDLFRDMLWDTEDVIVLCVLGEGLERGRFKLVRARPDDSLLEFETLLDKSVGHTDSFESLDVNIDIK